MAVFGSPIWCCPSFSIKACGRIRSRQNPCRSWDRRYCFPCGRSKKILSACPLPHFFASAVRFIWISFFSYLSHEPSLRICFPSFCSAVGPVGRYRYAPALGLQQVGDPLAATTHTDLFLRAAKRKIQCTMIHNASIMNAVACCGLQLYNFGQSVSLPFFKDNWRPTSWYEKIKVNKDQGFHTLCLLDIKVSTRNIEMLLFQCLVLLPSASFGLFRSGCVDKRACRIRGQGRVQENTDGDAGAKIPTT